MWEVAYNLKLDFRLRDRVRSGRRGMVGTPRTLAVQAPCRPQIIATSSATPIANMRISSQDMGATSLAGWTRARVISFSQPPTARRFIGVFSVGDAEY
jgi:hypothetical protein